MRTLTKSEMKIIERQAIAFHWSDEKKESEIDKKQKKTMRQPSEMQRMLGSADFDKEDGML